MTDRRSIGHEVQPAPPGSWWVEWQSGGQPRHVELRDTLRIGRSPTMDVVLDDPYASREHCTLALVDGSPFVDARGSLNRVRIGGRAVETGRLSAGSSFTVGETPIFVHIGRSEGDTTWILRGDVSRLALRKSTRELADADGRIITRFSTLECAAFACLAECHPDAADHARIGRAVWGEYPFDQYQIHRLLQRIRERLGDQGDLIENVRGAGYRVRQRVDLW